MGIQARLVRKLPAGIRAYPLDVTFCLLGLPSGVFHALGLARSSTLAIMPSLAVTAWGLMLAIGCSTWLLGTLTTREDRPGTFVITRIAPMIFGLSLVSGTALVYGTALIILNGWKAVIVALPLLTFAIGTHIRRLEITGRLRDHYGRRDT